MTLLFQIPLHLGADAGKLRDSEIGRSGGGQGLLPTMPNSGGEIGFEVTYRLIVKVLVRSIVGSMR
jgi:hypothetical protein